MKMRNLLSFLIVLILISGCVPNETPSQQNLPLRVAYTDWAGDYVIIIAQELGFFESHGITVEPVYYPTFSDAYTDISVGKIDAINAVIIDLLPVVENDNLRVVMISDSSDGGDAVVSAPDINSVQDLRNKRIGVVPGTFGELLVREMLRLYNININEVQLVNVPPDQILSSIPEIIDAGHTWEPFISDARDRGNLVIFTTRQLPGLFPDVMTFRKDIVTARPDDVRSFIDAWFEAAEYWTANPEAGSAIIAQYTGQMMSDISFKGVKIYSRGDNQNAFSDNPGTDLSSIYFVGRISLDFSISAGYISTPPDINVLIDPQFILP